MARFTPIFLALVFLFLLPGSALALTEYYALLVSDDEVADANDSMWNAMKRFDNWNDAPADNIRLNADDYTGTQILTELEWLASVVDEDDVAIFFWSGHGGRLGLSLPLLIFSERRLRD